MPWLEKADAVDRVDGPQDTGSSAMCTGRRAPGRGTTRRDRAEPGRHGRGAAALDREQADQDGEAQRHHVGSNAGVTSLRPSTADSTEIAGVMIASP